MIEFLMIELFLKDIAATSVEIARDRYRQSHCSRRMEAHFYALDCLSVQDWRRSGLVPADAWPDYQRGNGGGLFDVASMQFAFHYAFESEAKLRCLLQNVRPWIVSLIPKPSC